MRFSHITKSGRNKTPHKSSWFPDNQHPDLPLNPAQAGNSPQQQQQQQQEQQQPRDNTSSSRTNALGRSASVRERTGDVYGGQGERSVRSSIAVVPGATESSSAYYASNDVASPPPPQQQQQQQQQQQSPNPTGGLTRSQTLRAARRAGLADSPTGSQDSGFPPIQRHEDNNANVALTHSSSTYAVPGVSGDNSRYSVSMSNTAPKTSQDSGQQAALDRSSQRRLQRLKTEQGFREQRQGGQSVLSPQPLAHHAASLSTASPGGNEHAPTTTYYGNSNSNDAQPQFAHHLPAQPHPAAHGGYQQSRTGPGTQTPNVGLAIQTQPTTSSSSSSRSQHYPPADLHTHAHVQQSPEVASHDTFRPPLTQSRSFSQQTPPDDAASSMSSNAALPAPKATRAGNGNRQSVHNGLLSREGSHAAPVAPATSLNASGNTSGGQGQSHNSSNNNGNNNNNNVNSNSNTTNNKANAGQQAQQSQNEIGRGTPQPVQVSSEEMTREEVDQVLKEHKELREKYTKVKKYYFEKEDQVKQLQNSLAHQRLSQSRTSLDDSEYTTRFNRLDGLIAQLAFSIRKSWKSIPQWLINSVNRDAVVTGKQEMTAAGRAFISCWLVEEVFDKYFHPDLETSLSVQLKSIQRNIRRSAPIPQTTEEEEYLTSKIVNWRLATLEGLGDTLRSAACADNRQKLTDTLKDSLVSALAVHLQEPPPSDLEGGVHMIIELVVSIAIHLPLESRDVVIEYFMPGYSIMPEQMKAESGIPPLTTSVAEDTAERASMKSAASDLTDLTQDNNGDQPSSKKRSMLSALTGTGGKSNKVTGKHAGAGGSSNSLNRPESSHGIKEDVPPRVRIAAGIGVQVRGRSILVKASVFST